MNVAPRLFTGEAMTLIGRHERYALADAHGHIPIQWAWFGPRMVEIAARQGADTFGVCSEGDDAAMTYLCAVRASPGTSAPADLVAVHLPALRYAGFHHSGPVATLSETLVAALGEWLPAAGLAPCKGDGVPDLLEHYGPGFDPQTGLGGFDIWIPIASAD